MLKKMKRRLLIGQLPNESENQRKRANQTLCSFEAGYLVEGTFTFASAKPVNFVCFILKSCCLHTDQIN